MKIPASVRKIHEELEPLYKDLEEKVEKRITHNIDSRWHYEGRVKEVESFALKLETGRVENPQELEDFFACTIVVENRARVEEASKLIKETLFDFVDQRPKDPKKTHKRPDSFQFDDLRIYCRWKDGGKPSNVAGLLFEVQIKTYLQHAWSIATHDLIYKSANSDWGKERIAFQVKAMLEHAEVAIQEAEHLAQSEGLLMTNRESEQTKELLEWQDSLWGNALPADKKRLAKNIENLLTILRLEVSDLKNAMDDVKLPLNLSPYATVLEVLLKKREDNFRKYARNRGNGGFRPKKIFIPQEVSIPGELETLVKQSGNFICL